MKYPQLSLRETNAPYMEEMKTAAAEVIEGGWYIRGKYVSRLEEQLCAYLGCRYAVATGNGLDALRLMLRAYIEMGVMQPGDEVIVPSNTYVASVLAITDNGLVPVFVEPSIHTRYFFGGAGCNRSHAGDYGRPSVRSGLLGRMSERRSCPLRVENCRG